MIKKNKDINVCWTNYVHEKQKILKEANDMNLEVAKIR